MVIKIPPVVKREAVRIFKVALRVVIATIATEVTPTIKAGADNLRGKIDKRLKTDEAKLSWRERREKKKKDSAPAWEVVD